MRIQWEKSIVLCFGSQLLTIIIIRITIIIILLSHALVRHLLYESLEVELMLFTTIVHISIFTKIKVRISIMTITSLLRDLVNVNQVLQLKHLSSNNVDWIRQGFPRVTNTPQLQWSKSERQGLADDWSDRCVAILTLSNRYLACVGHSYDTRDFIIREARVQVG